MNLGGTPNINLSETTRFLKQSNVGVNVSLQNQHVPPPMMFMQQAVAMQQFQFQQALLMQQVMATQQAAARAANVKSAQEMSTARAAEISKLLKGIEADVDKKKSPQRSISRTPSRSHSRSQSFSRSKSQSPLRYRKDRSMSRSPIRYKRDSHISPIPREYFGYRGRSRRAYYRGRREYSWNPSYRRDCERERDQNSLCSRRSRSRSRSRFCCRSRTPSYSPRSRRERSITPLRYCHKEYKLERNSQQSRSLETKPTPSCSQSQSYSRSCSHSESLHDEHGSQSPAQMLKDKKNGGDCGRTKKMSLAQSNSQCTLMKNPDTNGVKENTYSTTITHEDEDIIEQWNCRPKNEREQSNSPTKSLSISFSPPKIKERGKLANELKTNDWKKAMVRDVFFQRIYEVTPTPHKNKIELLEDDEDEEDHSIALVEQQIDIKEDVKSKEGEFVGNQQNTKKEFDKMEPFGGERGRLKEANNLQDDINANELEKIKCKEYQQEMDKKEEVGKNHDVLIVVHEDVKDYEMASLECLDMETRNQSPNSTIAFEDQDDVITIKTSKKGMPHNVDAFAKPNSLDETIINNLCIIEEIPNMVSNGNLEDVIDIDEELRVVANETIMSNDEIDREGNFGLIFEGPMLPQNLEIGISGDLEEMDYTTKNSKNIFEKTRPTDLSLVVEEENVVILKMRHKSKSEEVQDVNRMQRSKDKSSLKDDNEIYGKCKLKEKSQLKAKNMKKKCSDKNDYEKRKEKHRKHKKRHLQNQEIEKEENDNDENKDFDFNKTKEERHHHCNKKHGRLCLNSKEDKHEKRRHRHKDREKSTLELQDKESSVVKMEGKDLN